MRKSVATAGWWLPWWLIVCCCWCLHCWILSYLQFCCLTTRRSDIAMPLNHWTYRSDICSEYRKIPSTANTWEKYFTRIVHSLLHMFSFKALGFYFDDTRRLNTGCRLAPKFMLRVIRSLWYLTRVSAAMLLRNPLIYSWYTRIITHSHVFRL